MTLAIAASQTVVRPTSLASAGGARPSAPAKQVTNTTGTTVSVSQETAALNRALGTYQADLAQGEPASALSSLARTITADAKALGKNVALPKAPATPPTSAAPPAESSARQAGSSRLDTVV